MHPQHLKREILSHKRTGGAVHAGGATAAQVVWSGHVNETPTLSFPDVHAQPVSAKEAKEIIRLEQQKVVHDSLKP